MAYEIVSTSSPCSLDGKAGFGTVIKTQRLPMALDIAVSGLNGYTHLFGAGNPQNPVCWSHIQIRADNKTFYVLSRIADCGADHTLRSNRLASHLILHARELTACSAGPAAIMQGGEIISSYNGSAREVPERTIKPYGAQPAKVCQRWKQLTGDAGWAGLLADCVVSNKPAYVIYNPGMDILPLFAEALNLVPTSFRWKVTFTTYYSSQIERYNCLWRGIVAGSPGASAVPQGDFVVIDLTKPLPALNKTSNMITLARSGAAANPTSQPTPTSMGSVVNKGASASGTISTSPLPSVESTIQEPMTNSPMSKQFTPPVIIKQKASLKGVWITMFLLFLLIGATGGGLYYMKGAINKSLDTNYQNLSAELSSVQDAFNSFKKGYDVWKSESDKTSQNQNDTLTNLKNEVVTHVDKYNSQVQKNGKSIEEINKDIEEINKDIKNINSKIEGLEKSIQSHKNENSESNTTPSGNNTGSKDSSEDIKQLRNDIKNLKNKIENLNNEIKPELEKLKQDLSDMQKTSTIRIAQEFKIAPKYACAFVDGKTNKTVIRHNEWTQTDPGGKYEATVIVDNVKIHLTYIDTENKFTAEITDKNVRQILSRYPFSVASSAPVYFN